MTQRNVEMPIGRLAADAEFRSQFERDSAAGLDSWEKGGLELNRVERQELLVLDSEMFEARVPSVSPGLQRAGFTPEPHEENGRSS